MDKVGLLFTNEKVIRLFHFLTFFPLCASRIFSLLSLFLFHCYFPRLTCENETAIFEGDHKEVLYTAEVHFISTKSPKRKVNKEKSHNRDD